MKRRKRNIDRLSGLPDEVLCHILSFLPTKTSACTNVLAKRWRFMWAHVPNLEFCRDNFSHRGSEINPLRIINRVIMLHEANIVNTFKLSNVKVCAYELETLIIYAIKRSVRNLYLECSYVFGADIVCTLPRFLFTYKTVVDLKLVHCGVIPSSGELFLPSLKKLNLSYVDYEDDESLPHLLSGCPVLEELTIHDCDRAGNSRRIIVSSPTIKTLNVNVSERDTRLEEMLIIDAPVLLYLKVDYLFLEFVKSLRKTMTSLNEAEFTLHQCCYSCDIDCTKHGRSLEFLNCLSNVRCLKIFSTNSYDSLVDIVGSDSMPKFVNLTKLKIGRSIIWYNLIKILEVADNLEHLIIDLRSRPSYKERQRVPLCMLSCLRTVGVIISHGRKDAFDIVRYILRNAQILEWMEISSFNTSDEEKLDLLHTISLFERVSKSCQVALNTTLNDVN